MAFTKAIGRDSYVRLRRNRVFHAPRIRRNVNFQDLINRLEQIRLVNRVTFTFRDELNLLVFDGTVTHQHAPNC